MARRAINDSGHPFFVFALRGHSAAPPRLWPLRLGGDPWPAALEPLNGGPIPMASTLVMTREATPVRRSPFVRGESSDS